jgi:hypothetical protein
MSALFIGHESDLRASFTSTHSSSCQWEPLPLRFCGVACVSQNERRMTYLIEDQGQPICLQDLDASKLMRRSRAYKGIASFGWLASEINMTSGPRITNITIEAVELTAHRQNFSTSRLLCSSCSCRFPLHRPRDPGHLLLFASCRLRTIIAFHVVSLTNLVAGDMRLLSSVQFHSQPSLAIMIVRAPTHCHVSNFFHMIPNTRN